MRRAVALLGLSAFLLLLWAAPAGAQFGERIERYSVSIVIDRDGSMVVQETIAYDFGTNQRHGIFRNIPVRFRYDDRYDRVYRITGIDVEGSEGTPDQIDVSDSNNQKVIRIGDPDREISGRHTYVIRYRVHGALNHFPGHDELYWNAIGTDWSVPIGVANVQVSAPAPLTRVACFAGPQGSSLACGGVDQGGGGAPAAFTNGVLQPGHGMTVVAALPLGTVTETGPILDERWNLFRAFSVTPRTVGLAGLLGVLSLGGIARLVWKEGRDRRDATTPLGDGPVEYRPPDGLRPAQIGVLIDERANPLDVTATIVDLAVQGHLTIEELPKSWLFGKADWKLSRAGTETEQLLSYERTLLNALFEDGDEVTLSDLKNEFADDLRKVQKQLYNDSVQQGWFTRRPDQVRSIWTAVGIGALILSIGITVLLAAFTHSALVGVPLVVAGLVLLVAHRWMPFRTAKGSTALARARGFRRFIETAKAEEMQFAEDQQRFVAYLPYAIVFGATKQWARVFADLGATATASGMATYPSWYSSPNAFNAGRFGDSMDSFAVRTSGTIVSTPASSGSSGFSGGSSGGGGGGGGGGSW